MCGAEGGSFTPSRTHYITYTYKVSQNLESQPSLKFRKEQRNRDSFSPFDDLGLLIRQPNSAPVTLRSHLLAFTADRHPLYLHEDLAVTTSFRLRPAQFSPQSRATHDAPLNLCHHHCESAQSVATLTQNTRTPKGPFPASLNY